MAITELSEPFPVPVDVECKATVIRLCSFAQPHMRAFHLAWLTFFSCFFTTFAPAALLPIIRDNLNLNDSDIGDAGVASVCGGIVARILMGTATDTIGPRYGIAVFSLLTAPATFCTGLVSDSLGFIFARLITGFSLGTFVSTEAWCTAMFTTTLVGSANAVSAGWGNLGGGCALLLVPLLYLAIAMAVPSFEAWRWCLVAPSALQLILGLCPLLFGQDRPDLHSPSYIPSPKTSPGHLNIAFRNGTLAAMNYRTWILALVYAFNFGVELTLDNIIVQYMYDQFNMSVALAGIAGASAGLGNIFARASGGILSDLAASKYGMRLRLWVLWSLQFTTGLCCIGLGLASETLWGTVVLLVALSLLCQAACGATYAVVPFVSRRALGTVSGFVAAGGSVGAAILQAAFFSSSHLSTHHGLTWMGVLTVAASWLLFFIRFPMWGGMISAPEPQLTEEVYYLSEYSPAERAAGLHIDSLKFAHQSRSQRSRITDPAAGQGEEVAAP